MKRYIIYAAIIFLAAYFGDKQQSESSQLQSSSIVKSDTSFISIGKNSAAATRDTVNVTYPSQLSVSR